ncbi:recombinase family protein [Kitasatospora sp. NPDC001527]|uniref:recombinase family protein n=1 Tax=Kitasatospora sp. NPDC001527 TaxID=3154519 RepID=UPI003326D507
MHDVHEPVYRSARRSAMYLRCRPYDPQEAEYVRSAMEHLAHRLALPHPDVYADHGLSTRGPLPALASLLTAAERGWVDVVLVPGPFVFSLDDRAAADIVRRLARAGCEVVEAPGRVVRPTGPLRDAPVRRHLAVPAATAPLPDGAAVVSGVVSGVL